MNDNASVTSSLAVAEKTPRKNGGCVGMFFQLFDWNRRFTKKKLFSKRLLPPDRAKDASKKFGGDDKLPRLRLIADENSGGFPNKNKNGGNGVQTPSLVARLMGLESMPQVNRDQVQKDDSGELTGGRREKVVGDNGEFRPQKLRKTGMVDTRSVTRFGAEALQLKNVLSQSRKHHHPKLASLVKNASHHTKRNTSRLMGAATRILEPGLQARNKSRYVISNGRGARHGAPRPLGNRLRSEPVKCEDLDPLSGQASCKNCGNLIDVVESTSNQQSPSTYMRDDNRDQLKFNCFPFSSETEDFDALNRDLSGRTRSRVPTKVEVMKFESGRANCLPPRQKRQVTHTRRILSNAQSSRKQTGSDEWQPDYQGQIRNKNSDDAMTFRFSSPMKNICEVPTKGRHNLNASPCKTTSRKRFTSNPSDEKICLRKPLPSTVSGYESGINGNPPKTTTTNIFQESLRAFRMKRSLAQNDRNHFPNHHICRHDHCTKFCLQPIKSEIKGIIGGKNSDHFSPGSVLEASFSNDSCCSSSLEDSSVRTQHADSMSYSYDDESQFQESETDRLYSDLRLRKEDTHNNLVADLLTYISQVLCSMNLMNSRINRNITEVIFNSEIVLGNQMPHNPNGINSFFICDVILELDTLADVMRAIFGNILGSQNSNAGYQLKRFVFDSLIEYLESKYAQYSKCGFRSWMNLPRFMDFDSLILEVVEEVRRWMDVASDELVVGMDMSHGSGKWLDFEIEAFETGARVELDIVQTLIDEIVIDIYEDGVKSSICTN